MQVFRDTAGIFLFADITPFPLPFANGPGSCALSFIGGRQ
jgi:hypothetical protein